MSLKGLRGLVVMLRVENVGVEGCGGERCGGGGVW